MWKKVTLWWRKSLKEVLPYSTVLAEPFTKAMCSLQSSYSVVWDDFTTFLTYQNAKTAGGSIVQLKDSKSLCICGVPRTAGTTVSVTVQGTEHWNRLSRKLWSLPHWDEHSGAIWVQFRATCSRIALLWVHRLDQMTPLWSLLWFCINPGPLLEVDMAKTIEHGFRWLGTEQYLRTAIIVNKHEVGSSDIFS